MEVSHQSAEDFGRLGAAKGLLQRCLPLVLQDVAQCEVGEQGASRKSENCVEYTPRASPSSCMATLCSAAATHRTARLVGETKPQEPLEAVAHGKASPPSAVQPFQRFFIVGAWSGLH